MFAAESNYDPRMIAIWLGCIVMYGLYKFYFDRDP